MNKIEKLFKGAREDIAIGIELLFAKYPEIRNFVKKEEYRNREVVYYKDIAHIIPNLDKLGTVGMLTPESIEF